MSDFKEVLNEPNRKLVQNKTSDFGSEDYGLNP